MIGFMGTPPKPSNSDSSKADTPKRTFVLFDPQRPWTANAERSWHFHKRADMVRSCRERFYWFAKQQNIPNLEQVIVVAEPHVQTRRSLPDVGACYPAVKAAIDGLVDAGVIPNDTPEHLTGLLFLPARVQKVEGMKVYVIPSEQALNTLKEIFGISADMT